MDLWTAYKAAPTRALRNVLIEQYLPLVRYLAGRIHAKMRGHGLEREDLESMGVFGLMNAIEGFDPARGVKFQTYASVRIRGAILDEVRRQDWMSRHGRELVRKGKVRQPLFVSLHEAIGNEDDDPKAQRRVDVLTNHRTPAPGADIERRDYLLNAVCGLKRRDRQVVMLYYVDELNMREVAQKLRVTESWVSVVHKRALAKMRESA